MEVLVSLGIASVAFASFLAHVHMIRQQQAYLSQFADATFLLQSIMEEIRHGRFVERLDSLKWTETEDGRLVHPSEPAPYDPQSAKKRFFWQLERLADPLRGVSFKVSIGWNERGRTQRVSAAMQVFPQ